MPSPKWEQYTQALIKLLESDFSPSPEHHWLYQLLLMPTFHAPACISISGGTEGGFISFSLLEDQSSAYDVFQAIWQQKTSELASPQLWRPRACVSDMNLLTPIECQTIAARMSEIKPLSLSDIESAERDGIALRGECAVEGRHHVFHISCTNTADAPQHLAFIALMLTLAYAHFSAPAIQQCFPVLRSYLPDLQIPASLS